MSETPQENSAANPALYWQANTKLLLIMLSVWFLASFGLGILFVDQLDQFRFMGFPFGFWMAQQGYIVVFLVIIAVYVFRMNKIDRAHGVEEEDVDSQDF
tara:strand:- start:3224 stop:3523 length:300 start_codon:yes stop_codon:yes gene_type:complete